MPDDIEWVATKKMLGWLHPENPRDHFEEDIQATAFSLLEAGWAEFGITRQENGFLLGGHGRVLAADWLGRQTEEWFEYQWNNWTTRPERQAIAHLHRDRFSPGYWRRCPVRLVNLDEHTQKATMVRLNNQRMDGRDDLEKIRAILAQLPEEVIPQAGWEVEEAKAFVSEFMQKRSAQSTWDDEGDEGEEEYEDRGDRGGSGEGGSGDREEREDSRSQFPLAIVLNWKQWRQWKQWKESTGVAGDTKALLKGHPAFETVD